MGNVRKLLLLMWRRWYYYLIALIIAGAGAYYFIKNKIPTYRVSATILIEEGERAPQGLDLVEGFAASSGARNMDNQILILNSYTLIRKTVEELPFEIDVYRKGFRSRASYYPLSPLRIEPGPDGLPYNTEFVFEHSYNDVYHLATTSKSGAVLDTLTSFGQRIHYDKGSFIIYPQPELDDVYKSGDKIYIQFYDKERLTNLYMGKLSIERATRDGTIVRLSISGTSAVKDMIFLDKLIEVYVNENLKKKNQEADRTITFIEDQLENVSDSLMLTETQLQEFRSRNRVMNVSAQAEQIIDQAVELENEKARLTLVRNYYDYLEEYLSSEDNEKTPVAPASMGIEDPLLASLMQELAGLQAQYFSGGAGERNPLQGQLEIRIKNTKQSIKETLTGIKRANQMALAENTRQIEALNSQAAGLPVKERQLLGFERKFNLNNVLYTFLLQSRAEAQMRKASNTPDHEIIDPARITALVSPNRRNAFAFAFALAIALPTLLIFFGNTIHNQVTCEEDLKLITQLPVVAHFPHSRLSYNTVVLTEPDSTISEAFRSLRTRMEFFTKDIQCPVILITSSMPAEGKTFAAVNLASAYSLAGKRTLLVGFDLRRPALSKSFELNGAAGLTNYLIGKRTIDNIIYETGFDDLHIIPSGPIPPNPGELTSSEKSKDIFTDLRDKYDFIILDSAPIGVVSDIYPIAAIADVVLIMVRHGHTKRNVLSATLSEVQGSGINGLSLLVNDIKTRGSSYRYAYKYKYKYDHKSKKGRKT